MATAGLCGRASGLAAPVDPLAPTPVSAVTAAWAPTHPHRIRATPLWAWLLAVITLLPLPTSAAPGAVALAVHPGSIVLDPVLGTRVFPAPGQASTWCVWRSWPDEHLRVMSSCNGRTGTPHRFTRGSRGELVLLAAAADARRLVLAIYDAPQNLPSGRIAGVVHDGTELIEFDIESAGQEPTTRAQDLQLGGFDNQLHLALGATGITACGIRSCQSTIPGGGTVAWPTAALAGYEFVEVLIVNDGAHALLRREFDGYQGAAPDGSFHYAVAHLSLRGATVEPVSRRCLPWGLHETPQGPGWHCARGTAGVAELIRFELGRLRNSGAMDYAASNREGRSAWSQAYYLGTLAAFAAGRWPALMPEHDAQLLGLRVRGELDLLARQASLPGGYTSVRYSLHRQPLLFALHLGRIARTLQLGVDAGFDSVIMAQALATLRQQLATLDGTVEVPGTLRWQGTELQTLRYRPGVDFWADGAPVPYNYISGYVTGLLAVARDDQQMIKRATRLMAGLQRFEPVDTGRTWRYWPAEGHDGWGADDGISANTPEFAGSPSAAHITYRSMDALALVELHRVNPSAVPVATIEHIAHLVGSGALLAWVNEGLDPLGHRAALAAEVAYRHARATSPWELAALPWALDEWLEQNP